MDILSIIGMILSLGAIFLGQHLEGGHISSILQFTAFIIVAGGTFGAVMLQTPMPAFIKAIKSMSMVFVNVHVDMKGMIAQLEKSNRRSKTS